MVDAINRHVPHSYVSQTPMLREGEIVTGKVLSFFDGRALVLIKGEVFVTQSAVPLKLGQFIRLRVQENTGQQLLLTPEDTKNSLGFARATISDLAAELSLEPGPVVEKILEGLIQFGGTVTGEKVIEILKALERSGLDVEGQIASAPVASLLDKVGLPVTRNMLILANLVLTGSLGQLLRKLDEFEESFEKILRNNLLKKLFTGDSLAIIGKLLSRLRTLRKEKPRGDHIELLIKMFGFYDETGTEQQGLRSVLRKLLAESKSYLSSTPELSTFIERAESLLTVLDATVLEGAIEGRGFIVRFPLEREGERSLVELCYEKDERMRRVTVGLELSRLGEVRAVLKLLNNSLDVRLFASSDEAVSVISSIQGELEKNLKTQFSNIAVSVKKGLPLRTLSKTENALPLARLDIVI